MESVRRMRREKGLSQQELADLAGVGQDSISAIETGKHEPHPRTLRKLANALGVEVADFFREPAVPLAETPETGPTEAEVEEERHVIPQAASSIKWHIEGMKKLKELREAELEEIGKGKGIGLREALPIQMELADKGLRDLMEEVGVLDFAEAVKAGRQMAEPEAIPLCYELLRRLAELEALSAEARVASGVASSGIYVEGVKGASEMERQLQEGTLERQGTES
jgi:transcriptional regulator with XRE-family HTH domain